MNAVQPQPADVQAADEEAAPEPLIHFPAPRYLHNAVYPNRHARRRRANRLSPWANRIGVFSLITIAHLANVFNFATIMDLPPNHFYEWLVKERLFPASLPCHCGCPMRPQQRSSNNDGFVWRCTGRGRHVRTIRSKSIFEDSKINVADLFLFICKYAEGSPISVISKVCGIAYNTTGLRWACKLRTEILGSWYVRTIRNNPNFKLRGIVEIDESLFGRRIKFMR